MRKAFAELIYQALKDDPDLIVLTGDLGMFVWDEVKKDFPERFINTGAAEQSMLDVAIGLSYSGKHVICYSITPFLLWRPAEAIRTYVDHEKLPILLVGSGRDKDYAHDGYSHDASDDKALLAMWSNIRGLWPKDIEELHQLKETYLAFEEPVYVNLSR